MGTLNADAPCPANTNGLGRFAKNYEFVVIVVPECIKGGCQHITCHWGAKFCYGCNRYNSISSTCPGPGFWHSTRFSPGCILKNNMYQVARMDHLTALVVNQYLSSNPVVMLSQLVCEKKKKFKKKI